MLPLCPVALRLPAWQRRERSHGAHQRHGVDDEDPHARQQGPGNEHQASGSRFDGWWQIRDPQVRADDSLTRK
jgi:hypothetical protein